MWCAMAFPLLATPQDARRVPCKTCELPSVAIRGILWGTAFAPAAHSIVRFTLGKGVKTWSECGGGSGGGRTHFKSKRSSTRLSGMEGQVGRSLWEQCHVRWLADGQSRPQTHWTCSRLSFLARFRLSFPAPQATEKATRSLAAFLSSRPCAPR